MAAPLTPPGPRGRIRSAPGSNGGYDSSGSAWPIGLGARSSADRASDSGSEGQRFKSSRAYHLLAREPLAQLVEQLTLNQ